IGCPFLKFFETPAYHKNAHANHHRHCSDRWLDILTRESGGDFGGGDFVGGLQGYNEFDDGGRAAGSKPCMEMKKGRAPEGKRNCGASTARREPRDTKLTTFFVC